MSVEKTTIPAVLYKYQGVSATSLENLANCQVWFSSPNAFNDPFDCTVRVDTQDLPDNDCEQLYGWLEQNHPGVDFSELFKSEKPWKDPRFKDTFLRSFDRMFGDFMNRTSNTRGVCCFSEVFDNILMWSHYANFHRGFCVGIETSCSLFSKAKRVEYCSDIPQRNPTSFFLNDDDMDILEIMIGTKYDAWSYEREWRAIHAEANKCYGYGRDKLASIYLGLNISDGDKQQILNIISGHGISIYQMTRNDRAFALAPERLT